MRYVPTLRGLLRLDEQVVRSLDEISLQHRPFVDAIEAGDEETGREAAQRARGTRRRADRRRARLERLTPTRQGRKDSNRCPTRSFG